MLLGLVFATNDVKKNMFGSTPYFYAIDVGAKYAIESFLAGIFKLSGPPPSPGLAAAIPVLTYHRIVSSAGDVTTTNLAQFRSQMKTLKKNGWQTITLKEYEDFMEGKLSLPKKSFLLTFDDGAKDSFYPVDPILNELGYNAVMYVIVHGSETPQSTYYLSPEEIKLMLATGRWEIGSHSYDGHRPYPVDANGDTGVFFADLLWNQAMDRLETPAEFAARVQNDLSLARTTLQNTYGVPVDTLAFPLGNETDIQGAGNYPQGAPVTERVASKLYTLGFLQTDHQQYTVNFPRAYESAASSTPGITDGFLQYRIHVDYDWNGQKLLGMLENGREKPLPYEDDFTADHGWITAWGSVDIGRNNFVLAASPQLTSAAAFLDGSALWKDYSFEASVVWHKDDVFLAADLVNATTYDACVFAPGGVHIQSTVSGHTVDVLKVNNPSIAYSDNAEMGIRVHGSAIECMWGYRSIAEAYTRTFSGGVGLQVWNPSRGTASVTITSIAVTPFGQASTTTSARQ